MGEVMTFFVLNLRKPYNLSINEKLIHHFIDNGIVLSLFLTNDDLILGIPALPGSVSQRGREYLRRMCRTTECLLGIWCGPLYSKQF
jgi:hypothetical protein